MMRQPLATTVLAIGGAAALMTMLAFVTLLFTNIGVTVDMRSIQFVLAFLVIAIMLAVRLAVRQSAHHAEHRIPSPTSARDHTPGR